MKKLKRLIFCLIVLSAIGIVFRGPLFRQVITYKSLGLRKYDVAGDRKLITYIENESNKLMKANPDAKDIIRLALKITSKRLSYSFKSSDVAPDKLFESGSTHCIGYAVFFSITCNHLFKKYKLSENWIAKAHKGQLFFWGVNIHGYFSSPFFKDHDFVVIENKKSGDLLAVDPTINDILHVDEVRYETR